jgi:hypothetical protein
MAAKKKTRKKQKKQTKKSTRNRSTSSKNSAKKKSAANRAKTKSSAKKKTAKKKTPKAKSAKKKPVQRQGLNESTFPRSSSRARSGIQSGDLQGLSDRERADSESVDELLEEGNALEAGVVSGVEEADDADEQEVRTHEVPEDDVPEEYLDKD